MVTGEAVLCHWEDQLVCPDQSGTCRRTGLTFCRDHLRAGEWIGVRKLLRVDGIADHGELVRWMKKQATGTLTAAASAWGFTSMSGRFLFLLVDLQTVLGFRRKNAVAVVRMHDDGRPDQIVGSVTVESKKPPFWTEVWPNMSRPLPGD